MNDRRAEALLALRGLGSKEYAPMNTANLQLEGVYALLAALLQALLDKKVLNEDELAGMLAEVEHGITADSGRPAEVRASNIEAMRFPVRFLKSALQASSQGQRPSFAEITARVRDQRAE
jgi:hypothetical protein